MEMLVSIFRMPEWDVSESWTLLICAEFAWTAYIRLDGLTAVGLLNGMY